MHLYCSCGHPIAAVARWDGRDFAISLYDEAGRTEGGDIAACPECGRDIRLGTLKHRPPAPPTMAHQASAWLESWLASEDADDHLAEYVS